MASVTNNMLSILFFIIVQILFSNTQIMPVQSFTVDLIHRDSPQSPLHNPLATNRERLNDAIRRSSSRVAILNKLLSSSKSDPKDIQSPLIPSSGEFLMKLYIGNPPVPQFVIVDSGSDVTWFQIKECALCFNQTGPSYDPQHSTTYRNVSCDTPSCKDVQYTQCSTDGTASCIYNIWYSDFATTFGYFGTETFTFRSASGYTFSIPKLIFGCGNDNTGIDAKLRTDGILGIGRGSGSFINQLSTHMLKKFSYCLPSVGSSTPNVTGKISFGNSVRVRTPGSVIVPLKKNSAFYIITMESISVNKKIFALSEEKQINETNDGVLVDSGTLLTYIPDPLYVRLHSEVQKSIPARPFQTEQSDLCYKMEDIIKFPKITFKFEGGAELELSEKNIFMQVDPTTICFAFFSSGLELGVLGNVFQSNFLVGFDLGKNLVSFEPSDCTSK